MSSPNNKSFSWLITTKCNNITIQNYDFTKRTIFTIINKLKVFNDNLKYKFKINITVTDYVKCNDIA